VVASVFSVVFSAFLWVTGVLLCSCYDILSNLSYIDAAVKVFGVVFSSLLSSC